MTPAPASPVPDVPQATCRVAGWRVFGPGYFKKSLYTPAMVARIAANFARLRGHLTPAAKLGHDKQQRLAKSLGFPNVGRVTGCRLTPDGEIELDIDGVPERVGGEINAGRLNSGSVELLPSLPDPDDPARQIDGPVLTGVAFLGEEQPAVKGFVPPRAVYPDGRPVPPAPDPADWFAAMARVTRQMSAESEPARVSYLGREYSAATICFSEMSPMNPELEAKLAAAGLTPEQVAKCAAALGGPVQAADAPPPAAPAGGATPPPAPPAAPMSDGAKKPDEAPAWFKAFADRQEQFNSDCVKRMGALEAQGEEKEKKAEEAQMAAFSEKVDAECKKLARKVEPVTLEKVVKPTLLGILTSKSFSAEAERLKTFSDAVAGYMSLPDDPRLVEASRPAANQKQPLTPLQQTMLRPDGLLAVNVPGAVKRIREAAQAA